MEHFFESRKALLAGIACFFLFFVIGTSVASQNGILNTLDAGADHFARTLRTPGLTSFMLSATEFGDSAELATVVFIALLVFAVFSKWRNAACLALGFYANEFLTDFFKNYFHRARPTDWLAGAGGYAYPSGHVTYATVVFLFILMGLLHIVRNPSFQKLLIAATCIIIVMVALSRIYLSVHWLSDTYGGILLGTGLVLVISSLSREIERRHL